MEAILRAHKLLKLRLTHYSSTIAEIDPNNVNSWALQIDKLDTELRDSYAKIMNECEDKDVDQYSQEQIQLFKEINLIRDRIQLHLPITPSIATCTPHQSPSQNSQASSSNATDFRLPSMQMPIFDGTRSEWPPFAAIFKDCLKSHPSLTETQKIMLLKNCLEGEAKRTVKNVVPATNTFAEVWKLLEVKFENKGNIIEDLVRAVFNHPPASSPRKLQSLVDTTRNTLRTLAIIDNNYVNSAIDNWVVTCLKDKLDSDTKREFERSKYSTPRCLPTVDNLLDFMQDWVTTWESTLHRASGSAKENFNDKKGAGPRQEQRTKSKCFECGLPHAFFKCPVLYKASVEDRWALVKKHKICQICFSKDHGHMECTFRVCSVCNKRHSRFLHRDSKKENTNTTINNQVAMLATAQVNLVSVDGRLIPAKFIVDSASTASYLHEPLFEKLGAITIPYETQVTTFNGEQVIETSTARVKIESQNSDFKTEIMFIATPHQQCLPTEPAEKLQTQPTSPLADPTYSIPSKIDGILGAEIFGEIMESRNEKHGNITAMSTKLGWVLTGSLPQKKKLAKQTALTTLTPERPALNVFWDLEEIPKKTIMSPEQQETESIFVSSTVIKPNGQYQVKIPINETKISTLSSTRKLAYARLKSMEKKMASDNKFAVMYKNVFADYLACGDLVEIDVSRGEVSSFYLPHHGVLSKEKLRIVFDASAKSNTGLSLNEICYDAPKTQPDLFTILLRFRLKQVAFTADIKQMYRQVAVHPDQHNFQRIVIRDPKTHRVKEMNLSTVTWGTKSAPFLATRVLNDVAHKNQQKFPAAAKIITEHTYVDDIMATSEDFTIASGAFTELTTVLGKHHFQMHKWASNSKKFMELIPPEQRAAVQRVAAKSNEDEAKALGISWDTAKDVFKFELKFKEHKKITKRSILAQANQIFDPLTWLAPVSIVPKLIMQELWKDVEIGWDTCLSDSIASKWRNVIASLDSLNSLEIPRTYGKYNGAENIQLIGYSDASTQAYAAVVYARIQGEITTTTLIAAKTKVAPIRPVSLPRLELCAAYLLAKLMQSIYEAMGFEPQTVAFTDSTITLAWIKGHASRWQTFVANRVEGIQAIIKPELWFHVESELNPADCASRGITPSELVTHPLWWSGPPELSEAEWSPTDIVVSTDLETKPVKNIILVTVHRTPWMHKISKFDRIVRVQAYVRRFLKMCREKVKISGPIQPDEFDMAANDIFRYAQQDAFPKEYAAVKKGKLTSTSSKLYQLGPFLDKYGVMRVNGRLEKSNLPFNAKHPVILPSKWRAPDGQIKYVHLTTVLVRDTHTKFEHAAPTLLENILRQQFWIVNAKSFIKSVTRKCVICARVKAQICTQLMASLPAARVTPDKCFAKCGIDYCGPVYIKNQLARSTKFTKAYIAIFICMVSRAIHLELVGSYDRHSFIQALQRLCGRRGIPTTIFADRGTNFTAGRKEIDAVFDEQTLEEIAQLKIKWVFSSPASPHMNGIWEAGVRSLKYHLSRVIGSTKLTFEEMSTVLVKVEACLNSRPITPMSDNVDDLTPLTPAHLLVGGPLHCLPERPVEKKISALKRWELTQQITQHFWRRWSLEYLTRLQNRPKWMKPQPNVQVGQLVILREDNMPPTHWKMGRILETHPGKDGLVRTVTVKTQHSTLVRPIVKISQLPIEPATEGEEDHS